MQNQNDRRPATRRQLNSDDLQAIINEMDAADSDEESVPIVHVPPDELSALTRTVGTKSSEGKKDRVTREEFEVAMKTIKQYKEENKEEVKLTPVLRSLLRKFVHQQFFFAM